MTQTIETIKIGPAHTYRLSEVVGTAAQRTKLYTVVEKLRTNVVIVPVGGTERRRINPAYLIPATEASTAPDTGFVTTIPTAGPPLYLGQPVLFQEPRTIEKEIFIILAEIGPDRYRIAKLGGDGGRYWRVSRRSIQPISVSAAVRELIKRGL